MCDYSLHGVASRPAKVGDTLKSRKFPGTITTGIADTKDPRTAVCLLPGTELKIDAGQLYARRTSMLGVIGQTLFGVGPRRFNYAVAKFTQVKLDRPDTHHDALEFHDGTIVMINDLDPEQELTVLQLPIKGDVVAATTKPVKGVGEENSGAPARTHEHA